MTPPVTTLPSEEAVQKLKYYQKGTFTVGNRLVAEEQRTVQASQDRSKPLTIRVEIARLINGRSTGDGLFVLDENGGTFSQVMRQLM